jgi:amino acid transporter
MATETKDPQRNVPLAVMAGPILLGAVYIVCTVAEVPGLSAVEQQLAEGVSAPAALALNAGLGTNVATATDLVLAVAAFAGLIGMINYASRCTMAIAADSLLPAPFTAVHPRFHSPHRAIVIMAAAGAILIAGLTLGTGSLVIAYTLLASLMTLIWIVPYVLVGIGAVKLTRRRGEHKPLVVIASTTGVLGILWVYVTTWVSPPAAPADIVVWLAPVTLGVGSVFVAATYRRLSARAVQPEPSRPSQ